MAYKYKNQAKITVTENKRIAKHYWGGGGEEGGNFFCK